MNKLHFLLGILLLNSCLLFSQVAINTDGSLPDVSAMLDVKSSTKGMLAPRMTFEQRKAIVWPSEGLMVVCINGSKSGNPVLSVFLNGKWVNVSTSCETPAIPVSGTPIPNVTQITWNWSSVPIVLGYKWNTVNDYNTATNLGNVTSFTETGLTCWTSYTRYLWAFNDCGPAQPLTLTQSTLQIPFSPAPTAGTHISYVGNIIWNWNTVSGASGYKWNTINDFATATDMGNLTFKTESGLTCGTSYGRFVWAYVNCGHSTPVILTQLSTPCPPTVTTESVSNIDITTATCGGEVVSSGGVPVTARGVCWSTSPNPTTSDNKTINGYGTGTFTSYLSGLTAPNVLYYVRAYATNSGGTSYGNEVSFSTLSFAIGQTYGGGIIFWINGTGEHGLISAATDQSAGAEFGCSGNVTPTSTAVGQGQANTDAILYSCTVPGIAAHLCDNLVLNGYSDWFLPSLYELSLVAVHYTVIGGFTSTYYWSSSESNSTHAWSLFMNEPVSVEYAALKPTLNRVRAIRAF